MKRVTFPPDQKIVVLDYETHSQADLKKVGAYEYAQHFTTEIICLAYRVGTFDTISSAKTRSWSPQLDSEENAKNLSILVRHLKRPDTVVIAHNAMFEQLITRFVLPGYAGELPEIPPHRWVCTAALAAALALPRKLEHACKALNLPVQKDMEGHRLMLKWSKPRRPSKNNPATRHTDPLELARIIGYCETDIDAEVALLKTVPQLSPAEREIWVLDQEINWRGIRVDRPMVQQTLRHLDAETERLTAAVQDVTGGAIRTTRQVAATLNWLEENRCYLPNLQKKTVEDALAAGMAGGVARELLELRQLLSRASTAKYAALDARSKSDGRVRDNLVYHAASTGRWGGSGVQLQNLPRPKIKNELLEIAIKVLTE